MAEVKKGIVEKPKHYFNVEVYLLKIIYEIDKEECSRLREEFRKAMVEDLQEAEQKFWEENFVPV